MIEIITDDDAQKKEPLKIDPEAVKSLTEVTKMWANLSQFEKDQENYATLKQQYN